MSTGKKQEKAILGERLKIFREKVGLTQRELASRMGYNSYSPVKDIETGQTWLKKPTARLAELLFGVSETWLLTGDGKMFESASLSELVDCEFTLVPKYKAKLSGGHGSFEISDQIEANLSFRTEFIRRKGNPKDMALFEIIGDSMEPFIYDGDVVLVDMSKKTLEDIVDGKAYAFREDHTVKVKRLSRQGNRLIATSENVMKYPPYEIIIEEFFLIGKVVWLGHEVT
ncbi:S24 family peptidase [Desulfogranum marinum]|uniref:XRE family transcriptional regulator n=1 Tax=Desulfogranum marinum TaxID=453220 RepID=UPI0029C9003B|nr:S24 family peptidase [Desulfogranum marinum]